MAAVWTKDELSQEIGLPFDNNNNNNNNDPDDNNHNTSLSIPCIILLDRLEEELWRDYFEQGPELGKGANGSVYAVAWKHDTLPCPMQTSGEISGPYHRYPLALKLPVRQDKSDPDLSQKYAKREFEALRQLSTVTTKYIVRLYQAYTDTGLYHDHAFLTERLSCSADQWLFLQHKAAYPLREYHVARIIKHTLKALRAAFSLPQPLFHRDIKPANIMATSCASEDKKCSFKVIDWGHARPLSLEAGPFTKNTGTTLYWSPERLRHTLNGDRGHAYDVSSDIWSVGCVAFFLLQGRPFILSEEALYSENNLLNDLKDAIESPNPPISEEAKEFLKQTMTVFHKRFSAEKLLAESKWITEKDPSKTPILRSRNIIDNMIAEHPSSYDEDFLKKRILKD